MLRQSVIVVLLGILATSHLIWAKPHFNASFPCANAKTILERTLCSDARLAAADVTMARAYTTKKSAQNDQELKALIESQRVWLETRSECGLPIVFPDDITDADDGARRSYRIERLRLATAVDCLLKRYADRTRLLTSPATIQASFPCEKATTILEKTICSDARLAAADRRMGRAYKRLRETLSPKLKEGLLHEQRTWNKSRFGCDLPIMMPKEVSGGDEGSLRTYRLESIRLATAIECLIPLYMERIRVLTTPP